MTKRSTWITGAAVGAGAIALALGSLGAAQAQSTQASPSGNDCKRNGTSLVTSGTVTQDQHDAVRAALQEGREGVQGQVLAKLVSDGTLTQQQADAISATGPKSGQMRGSHRELISSGTLTRDQFQAFRSQLREAMQANKADVLASLVAGGTLTQAQADEMAAKGQRGGKGMKSGQKRGWGHSNRSTNT